jgi:uncharacterized protein (DUF2225 family)
MSDLSANKISFFQKNDTLCPICGNSFKREELRQGGGRQIAGPLGEDLRRFYEVSKKFGEVYPLIYSVLTCPTCFYSAMNSDFSTPDPKAIDVLRSEEELRHSYIEPLFSDLDFSRPKTLTEGAAGYALSLLSYQHFGPSFSPTIRSGICSLRAAWCFSDLHRKFPSENWDYLEKIFYHKAKFFYSQTMEREQDGSEMVNSAMHFGPDVDNNFGFDGVMYLTGWLEYKYGSQHDGERTQSLATARRAIARLVGMGKSSKSKPSVLIEKAKELHKLMGEEIKD